MGRLLTLASCALLAACAGGAGTSGASVEDARGPVGAERCAAGATRVAGACWSAAGTRWTIDAHGPAGPYRFEVDLLAAGRARATDHHAASPATDEWFLDGGRLRILLSDRFVEYRAAVTNGTVLLGEAVNVRDQRWSFRADRAFGEAPCAPGEARLEGSCMTVAGTRWLLDGRVVAFLADGALALDAEEPTGRWTQAGAALTFSLGDERARVATVDDESTLRGRFEEGDGEWRATRVPSLPPVVRR
ncbi:MAG: hypothetical protein KF729_21620 [Sandaracinaceae bacterium]|nr:hypothetical protein [Sandaracinaceae bacterium]